MRIWTPIDETATRQGRADRRLRELRPRNIGRKRAKIRLHRPATLEGIIHAFATDGKKLFS